MDNLCVSMFVLYDWVVLNFEAFDEVVVGYRLSRKSRSVNRPRGYNAFALQSFLREWTVAVICKAKRNG